MKCKLAVMFVLALMPTFCLAQREGRRARGGGSLAMQLVEEISVLQRIVPLQLTDPQLDQILAQYAQHPLPAETDQPEAVAKLQEIKQRLLAGTPLVATDLKSLRDLMQEAYRGSRTPPAPPAPPGPEGEAAAVPLTPLEQALWGALTVTQRAVLLGDVRGPAANNQKASQLVGKRAIVMIGRMLPLDEARWLEARDKLSAALATGAGEPNTTPWDNCQKMFVEFFDRLRKMPQADFAARQDELAAELLALLPPGTNLVVAMAEYDTKLIHGAMSATLVHPRAPELIQQIKAARPAAQAH